MDWSNGRDETSWRGAGWTPRGRLVCEAARRRGQLCQVLAAAGLVMASPERLLYVEQLDLEDQRRVRRDHATSTARAVAERRRDRQPADATDLHALDAFVPALDHPATAKRERERLAAILRAIELLAVGQPARVVDGGRLARLRLGAVTNLDVGVLQAGRRRNLLATATSRVAARRCLTLRAG